MKNTIHTNYNGVIIDKIFFIAFFRSESVCLVVGNISDSYNRIQGFVVAE